MAGEHGVAALTDGRPDDGERDRPYVVVSVTTSVDGRVTFAPDRLLMLEPHSSAWRALGGESADRVQAARAADLEREHPHQATLEGSGSLVPPDAGPVGGLDPVPPEERDALYADHLPEAVVARPGRTKWFTVVDGRGRVRWTMKSVGEFDVLVLASRATPIEYLGYLRREGICYLVAGEERVDLAAALRRMRERLGVTTLVSTAGGGLNGALLRAGLVDELDLVVLPTAIGGAGTPTVFDGPVLPEGATPAALRLRSVRVEDDGVLRLRYLVERADAGR
ncbi:RibD family protein [Beutenbergia cavernae]|nr:dihydrofolate reductase family protein [Beutenbergia cavernae]